MRNWAIDDRDVGDLSDVCHRAGAFTSERMVSERGGSRIDLPRLQFGNDLRKHEAMLALKHTKALPACKGAAVVKAPILTKDG